MSENKTKVIEIFSSIQGEGPYVGAKQLFIRFSGCNLKCNYCDTEFINAQFEVSSKELLQKVEEFDLKQIHSISLTGGEPLLSVDFLKEFLPLLNKPVYLETNATLSSKLSEIIDFIDIISADIKLESSSGMDVIAKHDEFFDVAKKHNKEIFAKIVFDENIKEEEILKCVNLAKKYNILLVLQPKTVEDKIGVETKKIEEIFDKFLDQYPNTRLIPQVHKFLEVI